MLRTTHLAPVAVLAFLIGCTDAAKMPADAAIKGADSALASVRAEAAKYIPDQLKGVEDALAKAKDAFAKGDFKGALESAKDLPAKASGLVAAVAAKKDELTKAFTAATGQLPQLLETIKSRVYILSAAKKLPPGMDAGKLAAAKDGLASVSKGLEDATAKMKAGGLAEALAAAKPLKDKAMEIASSIGLNLGGAPTK
jgi:alkyl sulfatase BDS1-like metallo-beta-lactamase superfamily hydrolase